MPVTPTYPGVYIEEILSGVRTITGVATAITAFVGRAVRGQVNEPVCIQSYADYDRAFGGLSLDSPMSYSVQHFFQNGGTNAIIVRTYRNPSSEQQAAGAASDGVATLTFIAHVGYAAQGTLTVATNPSDGDTMTIDAKVYTFQLTLTDVDGNILIGADVAATRANIVAAINLSGTAGTQYAAAMTVHPSVSAATAFSGNRLLLTAKSVGTAGNNIATTETFNSTANQFDGTSLGRTRAGTQMRGAAAQGTLTVASNPSDGDTMRIDNKVYTFANTAAVAAQGTLTVASNPSDGDTMTIDDKKYTFQAALTDADGNIEIGSGVAATRTNIINAINRSGTPGTGYAATMTVHPTVSCAAGPTAPSLVLTAKTAGLAGNSIATQGNFTASGNIFDGTTLGATTEGKDAGVNNVDGTIAIGADVAATRANIVAAINLSGTAGTDYAASMTEHPTVSCAPAFTGQNLVLTADTPGVAGNSIATTETFTAGANVFDATTLGTTTAGVDPGSSLVLAAANPGAWGNHLRVTVDHVIGTPSDTNAFNLEVEEVNPNLPTNAPPVRSEKFFNVSVDPVSPLFVDKVLESRSMLLRVRTPSSNLPAAATRSALTGGSDGQVITDAEISNPGLEANKQGLWALEKTDLFNLLCIPPLTFTTDVGSATRDAALKYCKDRRAFYILDPPSSWNSVSTAESGVDELNLRDENVAVYFPRVRMLDPLRGNQLSAFVPSGVVAGIYARTDARHGVWKAPAGTEATMSGVRKLEVPLTDGENGRLNPLGVNCLRTFPVVGNLVWGGRTLEGADQLASEWKYVSVRRMALFIEESLYRGTKWVVFEPNDEPLWAQIRLNIGAFMHRLFRQGAFQGTTPKEAYFVKCDKETTTQSDINLGIVNIVVGFAPLKPAEFVIIKIQQIAGQIQA